jgi:hypothetical protein
MKIRIISIPSGPTPLWIRKLMVGLSFPVIEEADLGKYNTIETTSKEDFQKLKNEIYLVATEEIKKVLTNPEAIEWFNSGPGDVIFFLKKYCRQTF